MDNINRCIPARPVLVSWSSRKGYPCDQMLNYEEVMNLLQDALDINFQIGCLGIDDIYLIKSFCCYKLGLMEKCIEMLEKSE